MKWLKFFHLVKKKKSSEGGKACKSAFFIYIHAKNHEKYIKIIKWDSNPLIRIVESINHSFVHHISLPDWGIQNIFFFFIPEFLFIKNDSRFSVFDFDTEGFFFHISRDKWEGGYGSSFSYVDEKKIGSRSPLPEKRWLIVENINLGQRFLRSYYLVQFFVNESFSFC